jgi:hypothetical protein
MVQKVKIVKHNHNMTQDQERTFVSVLFFGALGYGAYSLFSMLHKWDTFDFPYNILTAFYYYSIAVPINTFSSVWTWLSSIGITPYPNINFLLSIIGIGAYGFLFLTLIVFIIEILKMIGLKNRNLINIMLLPMLLGGVWFIGSWVIGWLFQTN